MTLKAHNHWKVKKRLPVGVGTGVTQTWVGVRGGANFTSELESAARQRIATVIA